MPDLVWQVHLVRRDPRRLPVVLLVFCIAAGCVWLMFGNLLPTLAAVLLLIGSTSEYLFPITFRITSRGVTADALTKHTALSWKEARRCVQHRAGITLTPLPFPSRLDSFRGITIHCAPNGEPGDRASVQDAITKYATHLLVAGVPANLPPTLSASVEKDAAMETEP